MLYASTEKFVQRKTFCQQIGFFPKYILQVIKQHQFIGLRARNMHYIRNILRAVELSKNNIFSNIIIYNQSIHDVIFDANSGMIALQDTYNFNIVEMVDGNLIFGNNGSNYANKRSYISNDRQKLYFEDFLSLSSTAFELRLYDAAIRYLKLSIQLHNAGICAFTIKNKTCVKYNFSSIAQYYTSVNNNILLQEGKQFGGEGRIVPCIVDCSPFVLLTVYFM